MEHGVILQPHARKPVDAGLEGAIDIPKSLDLVKTIEWIIYANAADQLIEIQKGKAQYLGVIMGGTPTSIEDRRRGVFSYEALRSRLAQGRFAREDLKDMLAPIIRLQPLTYEELLVLIEKLMQIHAGYFGWTPTLAENDLVDFLKIEFGRVGADTHLTPREVIRDFIELLDILCQNPDANVAELLQSVGGDALAPAAATGDTGTAGGDRNFAEFTI